MTKRLLVFDTHPIQYRSPVFRSLYRTLPNVFFYLFNETFDANRWWFHERGQIPKQSWGLALLEGFPARILHTRILGLRRTYRRLRRILRWVEPSAVLIFGYYPWENWMLWWLCRRQKISLLFIGETFDDRASGLRKFLKHRLMKLFFNHISGFISIGKKNAHFYREWEISPEKMTTAHYCIDTSFFALNETEAHETRQKWRNRNGLNEKDFVLLFVGRLVERKRPGDILKIHEALSNHTQLYTFIIGNGLEEESLRMASAKTPRIQFQGFQDQAETRAAYYGADLLVVCSEFESWGLVVNEAFAAALPAMVTESCGVAGDLVVPDETGFVYPVGDIRLATKILECALNNPHRVKMMGQNARKKLISEYSVEQFSTGIFSSFRKAVM